MRAAIVGFIDSLAIAGASSSQAASLQVAPVSIEAVAPAAAATISLRNKSTAPLNAQIRVFRWAQEGGEEKLIPSDAVVASPPMATLAPGAEYTVRLVRLSKEPVQGEESYRLLVDELPAAGTEQNKSVKLVIRYSIPVFFSSNDSAAAKLTWSIEGRGGRGYLVAANAGDRHAPDFRAVDPPRRRQIDVLRARAGWLRARPFHHALGGAGRGCAPQCGSVRDYHRANQSRPDPCLAGRAAQSLN